MLQVVVDKVKTEHAHEGQITQNSTGGNKDYKPLGLSTPEKKYTKRACYAGSFCNILNVIPVIETETLFS